ncbi:MAG: putative Fe-S oxidoreductase [Deltaproteobacteria bacterium]|nr:putative Fe-S oxidoreductase [Deltaproteobacteria bacterium]
MMSDLPEEVLNIYQEVDRKVLRFQEATGLKCPPGCGSCCVSQEVEATVLEVLPLAVESFSAQQEDLLYAKIEEQERTGDRVCILYQPDPRTPGNGRCTYYKVRPLLCRLFGFAARKSKEGNVELCTCKLLRAAFPEVVQKEGDKVLSKFSLPVYQEISMRIAVLNPGMGFRRLPLNLAIRGAIEKVFWEREHQDPECRIQSAGEGIRK